MQKVNWLPHTFASGILETSKSLSKPLKLFLVPLKDCQHKWTLSSFQFVRGCPTSSKRSPYCLFLWTDHQWREMAKHSSCGMNSRLVTSWFLQLITGSSYISVAVPSFLTFRSDNAFQSSHKQPKRVCIECTTSSTILVLHTGRPSTVFWMKHDLKKVFVQNLKAFLQFLQNQMWSLQQIWFLRISTTVLLFRRI